MKNTLVCESEDNDEEEDKEEGKGLLQRSLTTAHVCAEEINHF